MMQGEKKGIKGSSSNKALFLFLLCVS